MHAAARASSVHARTCEPEHTATLAQQQLLVAARHHGLVPPDVGAVAHGVGGQVGGCHSVVGGPREGGGPGRGGRTSGGASGNCDEAGAGAQGAPPPATSLRRSGGRATPKASALHGGREGADEGEAGGRPRG